MGSVERSIAEGAKRGACIHVSIAERPCTYQVWSLPHVDEVCNIRLTSR